MMRTLLYSLVPNWKSHLSVCTVLGLEEGKECIIVGTLYKHMKLKPCILDEYSKERSVAPLVKPHNFMHQDDYLVLEDESGRVKLSGTMLSPSVYVTGVVVALHGKETSAGHLGDEKEQGLAAEIVHLVIAGNSVEVSRGLLNGQNLASKDQSRLSEPFKELDIQMTQIAANLPLDIMPGSSDPANFSLPQQPLNRCLFPGSATYNTFRSCTNPHCFELDNIRFLGTSGQNIDDLTNCPDVYFVGNQEKYETRLVKGLEGQSVRLICIPRFCETGLAVVVNMRNLECHALTFGTQFS
ncbi:hypothetical protein V6N12_035465 [Hibiscus sabdariffa]|uniref:DNA polymerase delta small subunit n=1 Tax=Hibiscus sabdariffa TaxID=183260 RepID=A0ABR2EN80_9ROSI